MIISAKKLLLALPFAMQFLYVLQGIVVFPFATGDAYTSWIFKGNILYLFGWQGFLGFLRDPGFAYTRPAYPVLFPLGVAGIYHLAGGVQELAVLGIYPLLYLIFCVLLYRLLRPFTGTWWAYLAAFLWATTPVIERHAGRFEAGFADLPLSLALFIGTVGLWHWLFSQRRRWLVASLIFLSLATHLKYEGWLWSLSLLVAGIVTLKRSKIKRLLLPTMTAILLIIPWFVYVKRQSYPLLYGDNLAALTDPSRWLRFGLVVRTLASQVVVRSHWGLTLIGLGVILLFYTQKLGRMRYRFLGLAISLQFLGYSLMYILSPLNVAGQLQSSFYRLVVQMLPLLFWLAFAQLRGENERETSG